LKKSPGGTIDPLHSFQKNAARARDDRGHVAA
jgi:hypothetical protein